MQDKPITRPSKGNKPESGSDRKSIRKRNSYNFWRNPVSQSGSSSRPNDLFCFWGRCPGCNPPSVLSSICLIGEPAPPAEDHRRLLPLSHRCRDPFHPQSQPSSTLPGRGRIIVISTGQGLVSAPPHRLSPGTSYDHNGLRHVGGVSSRPPSMAL